MGEVLLEVRDLRTYIYTRRGVVHAVNGASFSVQRGETLGIVGESGSGKSMTCLSIMRLLPEPGGRIVGGEILFNREDLLQKSSEEMRQIRGAQIAMILQDPMASLNPAFTVGAQIAEPRVDDRERDAGAGWLRAIGADAVVVPADRRRRERIGQVAVPEHRAVVLGEPECA